MKSPVQNTKTKEANEDALMPISSKRVDVILSLLQKFPLVTGDASIADSIELQNVLSDTKNFLSTQMSESAITSYISISDAIVMLEETQIRPDMIKANRGIVPPDLPDAYQFSSNMTSHTLLVHKKSRKFTGRRIIKNEYIGYMVDATISTTEGPTARIIARDMG